MCAVFYLRATGDHHCTFFPSCYHSNNVIGGRAAQPFWKTFNAALMELKALPTLSAKPPTNHDSGTATATGTATRVAFSYVLL